MDSLYKSAATKGWVAKVMAGPDMLDLERGLFKKDSPREIAKSMLASVKKSRIKRGTTLSSGISMMNYYLNRGGKNIHPKRKRIINLAKDEYRKLVVKEAFDRGFIKAANEWLNVKTVTEN